MRIAKFATPVLISSAFLLGGCMGDQKRTNTPDMYSQKRQSETESERQEFIKEAENDLADVNREINRMETKLQHEAQYVDASKKAEWSQQLFELRQEEQKLQAELQRARNASPEEWNEMRGTFGGAIDTLQAAVGTLAGQIEQTATGEPPGQRSDVDTQQQQQDVERATQERNQQPQNQQQPNQQPQNQQPNQQPNQQQQ